MLKLAWIALPILLYGAYAAWRAWRGPKPARATLNAHSSLLLMLYLLATAGLGVFWVANQQLPVFDWHYLFGYATLLLVALHLTLNLPVAWRVLTKRGKAARKGKRDGSATLARTVGAWLTALAAVAGAFVLGMRHGKSELRFASAGETTDALVSVVERYHEHASVSRLGVFARAPSVDWGARPPPFKLYPDAPSVALPSAENQTSRGLSEALVAPSAETGRFDIAELSAVLFHAAGITGPESDFPKRASPSSGGLFPTELYVIARDVESVPSGLYHYQPKDHVLERLSDEAPALERIGTTVGDAARVPAIVVMTSIFRRTGHKYRDRAYRYAMADAGHLLENLRLASAEAGLLAVASSRFDEADTAGLLGVDGVEEGVIAVVPLSRDRGPQPHGPLRPASPPDGPALGVTGAVHAATSLRAVDWPPSDEPGERTPLATSVPATAPVLATIRARRSQRRYTDEPIGGDALGSILRDAAQPPLLSNAARMHVVVNRASGIAPGIYRYDPAGHALIAVERGDFADDARSAALSQDVVGDAAAVVVFSARRDLVFAADGARGYRHAFFEVGAMGERVLLGAVARGLGACPVGAFYDDEAAELLHLDPKEEWVLHFATLGVVGADD